eukprot:138536-Heterocapsa_arctica.AAC.1
MWAMGMSRKQAMEYMQANGSLKYIYTIMIEIRHKGQYGCLGYVFFQQLDRKEYAKTLKNITTNDEVKWLQDTSKGMIVECILALGHLFQMGKCKELEGIMDMVVYMENTTIYKDKEDIREEE